MAQIQAPPHPPRPAGLIACAGAGAKDCVTSVKGKGQCGSRRSTRPRHPWRSVFPAWAPVSCSAARPHLQGDGPLARDHKGDAIMRPKILPSATQETVIGRKQHYAVILSAEAWTGWLRFSHIGDPRTPQRKRVHILLLAAEGKHKRKIAPRRCLLCSRRCRTFGKIRCMEPGDGDP
jgi:hypothetical protein